MIDVQPTPEVALMAMERHVDKMIEKFEKLEDYSWGGSECSSVDHHLCYGYFHIITGIDIEDEEGAAVYLPEFYDWALKATEQEIVEELIRLAKEIHKEG